MRVVLATNNPGKLKELQTLLPQDFELLTLSDIGIGAPEETGETFVDNALIKARAAVRFGDAAVADDSGLEVDVLGGLPGVRSARFAGQHASDIANMEKLLSQLAGVPLANRKARFVSAVAWVTNTGREYVTLGTVDGVITAEARGSGGFGYDPVFEISDADAGELNGRTMAELTLAEKNRISHRARAYRALVHELRDDNVLEDGALDA